MNKVITECLNRLDYIYEELNSLTQTDLTDEQDASIDTAMNAMQIAIGKLEEVYNDG